MQANNIIVIYIENTIFNRINFHSDENIAAGNCLFLSNSLKRNIENIIIIDTFSDFTTPGLIIIDDDIILSNLRLAYNFDELSSVMEREVSR